MLFHGFLLNFWCVFRVLARVLGKSWKQRFCNTFYVKSQIPRACVCSMFCVFWHTFLGLLPGAFVFVLGVFRCHFWLTFGAKGCSWSGFGGIENDAKKGLGQVPKIVEIPDFFRIGAGLQ